MRPLFIAGVLFFTLLTFYSALWFKSEEIEADITTRVTEDLEAAQVKNVAIDVDGRHVTLSGVVYDTDTESAYLDTADATYGALGPIDGLTLQKSGGFLKAVKSDDGITLTGSVPSDAARTSLLAAASDSTSGDVIDEMTIGAPEGAWTDEASFGLAQMQGLSSGSMAITPDSYTLSGITDDGANTVREMLTDRAGWQAFVSAPAVETGLAAQLSRLEADVSDRDTTIVTLSGERDTLATSLTAMTLSRDAALEQSNASVAQAVTERDTLAQELTSVTAERDGLSQTVSDLSTERDGFARTITDLTSERDTLTADVATLTGERDILKADVATLTGERDILITDVATLTGERDTALGDLETLRASLDDTQTDTAALRGELDGAQEQLASATAQLADKDTMINGLNGQITDLTASNAALSNELETQTASLNSDQQEASALRAQISEQTTTIDTLTANLGDRDAAISSLEGDLANLGETQTATLAQIDTLQGTLRERDTQVVDLNARLGDQDSTSAQTTAQMAAMAEQVQQLEADTQDMNGKVADLTAVIAARDATIADLHATAPTSTVSNVSAAANAGQMADQCSSRAGDVLADAQINFSSGTADIRSGSITTMERLTGIALACANSGLSVEIGGHTDSQGSDENNQILSENRATAIAEFMTARGVPADTLRPVGFGETQPIADNETREGRAKNRRISFEWQAR